MLIIIADKPRMFFMISKDTPPFWLNVEATWEVSYVSIIFSHDLRSARGWHLGKNRTNASLSAAVLGAR